MSAANGFSERPFQACRPMMPAAEMTQVRQNHAESIGSDEMQAEDTESPCEDYRQREEAAMHVYANEARSTQVNEGLLEFKAKLLNQLIELIRANDPEHDDQMAEMIRSAESYAGLKRQLDTFKASKLGAGEKRARTVGGDQGDPSADSRTSTNTPDSFHNPRSRPKRRA